MTRIASSNSPLRRSSDRPRPGRTRSLRRAGLAALLACALPFAGARAQDEPPVPRTPILVIDFDEVYRESLFGQGIQRDLDARRRSLAEEIAAIDESLAEEERQLTARRSGLSPEEFRALADAFDAKVQRLRSEQDEKARALTRLQADEQLRFRQAALPIVGQLMLDSGALIVVEKRSLVVFNDGIDVTDIAARRLDAATAGTTPPEVPATPPADAPDEGDAAPED
ncbi:MAG: OmpH family outer membrane protein [Rhodobacteraceae bacterium]|nr:MAG: OmpH family outer membrane protein [Paracoccaceae bacterium]